MSPFAFESRLLAQASSSWVGLPVEPARASVVFGDFLMRAPLLLALGMRLVVWLIPFLPLVLGARFALFGSLSCEERAAMWAGAAAHRRWSVRQLATLYKMLACLCAYDFDAP